MFVLFAILLAFLAQNLLTASPVDFAGVCVVLTILSYFIFVQNHDAFGARPGTLYTLFFAIVAVVSAIQLLPGPLAALPLFAIAGIVFTKSVNTASVESPTLRAQSPRIRGALQFVVIAAILFASAALCIYDNEHIQPGLHGDEAESGLEARNIDKGKYSTLIGVGWYDQPLPSFLVQAGGLRVFGDSISGLRTTSAVVGLLTLPLVFLLARKMFDTRVAFITLALMAFAHWFIAYARIGINYNQTTLLQVLAVLTFWEGWQSGYKRWFLLSGIATGAGLYLYFASRLVPILLVAFTGYILLWQRHSAVPPVEASGADKADAARRGAAPGLRPASLRVSQLAVWSIAMLVVFAPMGVFFLDHAKEFGSRAAFVFLFSDTQYFTREQKLQIYTGTTDVPTALAVQASRYAGLLNIGGDRSGQYGNSLPLVEYYTVTFFVLGLAYAVRHALQPRFLLLILWILLTLIIGGVLTIESPFSPRIVGMMPVPFMLAAVALDKTWAALRRLLRGSGQAPADAHVESAAKTGAPRFGSGRLSSVAHLALPVTALLMLAAIIYSNYWSYFDHYVHSIDGWAQREPATAVAQYAAQLSPNQTVYVLSAPELFVWHGTIRFIAPSLRGFDMQDPDTELPVRDPATRGAAFVMLPNHTMWLEKLQQLYPHGKLLEWRRPSGELWFVIYEAPAEDIEQRRSGAAL